jgi:hypothetical protein
MYRFLKWNSRRASRPPTIKLSYGSSIWSFFTGYPFYLTWYRTFPLTFLLDKVSLISYSSFPSISSVSSMIFRKSSRGLVLLLYSSSRDIWKVLYIFHFWGSNIYIPIGDTMFSITKGPYFLWSSLSFGLLVWIFLLSNITRSPILYSSTSFHFR